MEYFKTSKQWDETKAVGKCVVQRYRILGTRFLVHVAYEPVKFMSSPHSTITTFDGQWYGKIGTNPDNSLYKDLPVGQERFEAVHTAYEMRFQEAYHLILAAFPECESGEKREGEITTVIS